MEVTCSPPSTIGVSGSRRLMCSMSCTMEGHSCVNSAVMPMTLLSAGMRAAISSNPSPTR